MAQESLGSVNRFMRYLSSVGLGITLIAVLTSACIAGSIIGANEKLGVDYARAYVFHTWWFLGLMTALVINLVLCSWRKSYIALTLRRRRDFVQEAEFFQEAQHAYVANWSGDLSTVEEQLRRSYRHTTRQGNSIYAQRGLTGRLGAMVIHIGLILSMAAGFFRILADDFGWGVFDSTIAVSEGEATNTCFSRINRLAPATESNLRDRKLPFSIRALDFRALYHPGSSVARSFSSLIEVQDGEQSFIREVSMQSPVVYRGYKITQNSFSESAQITRGVYRVTNLATGLSEEVDAMPGDPVRVSAAGDKNHFLEIMEEGGTSTRYRILDLAGGRVVSSGDVEQVHVHNHGSADKLSTLSQQLEKSRYAVVVGALFPNFTMDENNEPSTRNEQFENPAALAMVFKLGMPNGSVWLFRNKEPREIVGHPHPELELEYVEQRKSPVTLGTGGLFDYEVRVHAIQKQPRKDLGDVWMLPGQPYELSVDDAIVSAPAVRDVSAHGTGDNHTTETSGGAGPATSAAGGVAPMYRVEFLGSVSGHVTYLGLMKDPSVEWLFAGCMIIIAGSLLAFLVPYSEAWAYYEKDSGRLFLATEVRGTSSRAHRRFAKLAAKILGGAE